MFFILGDLITEDEIGFGQSFPVTTGRISLYPVRYQLHFKGNYLLGAAAPLEVFDLHEFGFSVEFDDLDQDAGFRRMTMEPLSRWRSWPLW